jgi:hypothetical protein
MNVVQKIAERFGGIRPMARALDLTESTVRYWVNIGYVSGAWLQRVFEAGQALDPPLAPGDFFQQEDEDAAQEKERDRSAAAD